ncbi:receptor kinase At3g47110 [Olea europaea subsp. europaea]|uniref:non-specific serine/threonine protein kinase n=1 Tax=Olea europaea subsp. europaea TaxID=158383 RepID=A0A8S0V1F8_OLEEU|nr:receptor kinase At3g47110 [Olea europaea subsp. europaea]
MEYFSTHFHPRIPILYIIVILQTSSSMPTMGNETDRQALLDFKNGINQDPFQIMTSWNDSVHHCNWIGITCNTFNGRVRILNLKSLNLVGSLPPSLGNLSFLEGIYLRRNSFQGDIPQEIGRLLRMKNLNLSYNSFTGNIPSNLTHCTELTVLALGHNYLTGGFPAWIGNFSSLFMIVLALNSFQGSIPQEIGHLSRLEMFQIYGNHFSGTIPASIYNISTISYFSVTQNRLHEELPPDIGFNFPNLEVFAGGVNNFTGLIPVSISNVSGLGLIDFAENKLTGTVPTGLGSLTDNKLGTGKKGYLDFLNFLTNCTNLEDLGLAKNFFGGELPDSVANLSTKLNILTLGSNLMHGNLPVGIGNLVNLTLLDLEKNFYTGSIPDDIGKLQNLVELHFNGHELSGMIPASLGNLTSLTRLRLESNKLQGNIPSEIGNCRGLIELNLSDNNLTGIIPKEVMSLSSLSIVLNMAKNALFGPLPVEVGRLINLKELDVSENKLSGNIPRSLSSCLSLERLDMGSNLLQGQIPETLEPLRGLEEIDLSHNNLSGKIPRFFVKYSTLRKLEILSLEMIHYVVELQTFICQHARNPRLTLQETKLKSKKQKLEAFFSQNFRLYNSYQKIFQLTDGFSEDNLIGSGSFGSVYKGVLNENGVSGAIVAVKVLNLEQKRATKSFMAECGVLKSTRHRNLLKIISACSSVNRQGNEFKCLVYEFMINGNLEEWLHSTHRAAYQRRSLGICERLTIAIDVASALDYLHTYYHTPIVHCDLKPSNILLDEDLTAHVGDFGLAKFLLKGSENPKRCTMSSELKGSIGYIPLEYGSGCEVSSLGDVYSFGIVLLELFVGKRPTDDIFKDDMTIHEYVARALPQHIMEIVDPSLLLAGENDKTYEVETAGREEIEILCKDGFQLLYRGPLLELLISVLEIGLSCSNSSPKDRLPMNTVMNKLNSIKYSFFKIKNRRPRRR